MYQDNNCPSELRFTSKKLIVVVWEEGWGELM